MNSTIFVTVITKNFGSLAEAEIVIGSGNTRTHIRTYQRQILELQILFINFKGKKTIALLVTMDLFTASQERFEFSKVTVEMTVQMTVQIL